MTLTRRQLIGLVALTLAWGINWPMMKFALRELSPLYFRALTMSAGTSLLLAWYTSRGVCMKLPRAALGPLLLLALSNIFGWHLFSILGVNELASGRAATLGFTMPIWTVLLAAAFFGQPLSRRALVGIASAGGAVALLVAHEITMLAGRPLGVLWMQLAAVSWALGTILMRRTTLAVPNETITVWMMLVSALGFWAIAIWLEPAPSWRFSTPMWGALAWSAIINYSVAQVFWFGLARSLPPQASTFALMAVPLVGTLLAALLVQEVPGWTDWLAAGFIMAAIASALLPTSQRARS